MGELVDTLGNKEPGQLILAADWNALVAAIESTVDTINTRIDGVESSLGDRLTAVEGDLATLQEQVAGLETTVDVLREQHRVTLSTSSSSFALGQVATITAQVTDFEGNPLPGLNNVANRPWVDFFTVWGKLKAVAGFTNVGGAGERTIAVRVNADGIAQVTLRAESTEELSDEQEAEVAAALTMTVGESTRTVADEFLLANTPLDAQEVGAFAMMTTAYDGTTPLFRKYIDDYYIERPSRVTRGFTIRWRDYNATVIAMTKNDDDPLTPDRGRSYGSIRIRFRDWIQPWILLDYLGEPEPYIPPIIERLKPRVIPSKYGDSLLGIQEEIQDIVQNKGIIGRMRDYQVIHQALERIQFDDQPTFWPDLVEYAQNSVNVQQTMEYAQANTIGLAKGEAALAGFAAAGAQSDVGIGNLGSRVDELAKDVDDFLGNSRGIVDEAEGRFSEKLDATEKALRADLAETTGQFDDFDARISELTRNFTGINQRFNSEVPGVQNQLAGLEKQVSEAISAQISVLQRDVGVLQGRLGEFDRNFFSDGGQFQDLRNAVTTLEGQMRAFQLEDIQPSKLATGLLRVEEFDSQFNKLSDRLLQLERQRG